ncbi:MAG: YdcF family protein [Saprospiraceae bacterium]|nr:YdcF family protein [Saprospiraceae bacterium]
MGKEVSEAAMTLPFLKTLGMPDSDIVLETKSRNTRENAILTKVILDKMGFGQARCLLITSAFHVPRASAIFKKVGIRFSVFPAHFFLNVLNGNQVQQFYPIAWGFTNGSFLSKSGSAMLFMRLKSIFEEQVFLNTCLVVFKNH